MNKYLILMILGLSIQGYTAFGQLTIETCQEKAKNNYPQIKQYGLIEQTEAYNLSNANKGYLPQVAINAKATYQSDVTELNGTKVVNNDQYQAYAELNQTVWDGGVIRSQKGNIKASGEMEKQSLEVELYTIKDRVNQLFFGILAVNELITQNDLLQKELQTNYDKVQAYIQNGVANQSDADIIKVEQLKTNQRKADLLANQKSYKEMLSAMIGDAIGMEDSLVKPDYITNHNNETLNNRPELNLFEAQSDFYTSQESIIKSGNRPKVGLFAQGAYGNPGLNMFEKGFTPYYIVGARLTWNLGGFYTQKNNLSKISINKQSVDVQRETFLYNTNLKISQQANELEKIKEQIRNDDEIIELRTRIKETAEVKVYNGTLTVTDLIREINAENTAIAEKVLHEIDLLLALYNLKNTTNN
ncbi:TolC family protein [uncultured Draconibacterium sp.]|uniref:TolC family protein n=1 Tax=uncultured Draconibacterium sp. TaxID=1573823 RepID=UPI003216491F